MFLLVQVYLLHFQEQTHFSFFKIPEGAQTAIMLVKLKLIIFPVHVFYFTSEFATFSSQPSDLGILHLA